MSKLLQLEGGELEFFVVGLTIAGIDQKGIRPLSLILIAMITP
jgi:hypothetical protein